MCSDTTDTNPEKIDAAVNEHVTIKPKIELRWCNSEGACMLSLRERVIGANSIKFDSPATGQVMYSWTDLDGLEGSEKKSQKKKRLVDRTILFLVKRDDEELMKIASKAVRELTEDIGIRVLLQPELAAKLKHYYGVDNDLIDLFEPVPEPDFGSNTRVRIVVDEMSRSFDQIPDEYDASRRRRPGPDLVVTIGGDGLLMFASQLFPGAVPPILCVAGGSLGFLTPFAKHEVVDAIKGSLGLNYKVAQAEQSADDECDAHDAHHSEEPVSELGFNESSNFNTDQQQNQSEKSNDQFGLGNQVNISMRMRLDCRVVNSEGIVRARFNVLNEVVIDRGSSPYLANLEAFCDEVHLTTVQADGIIFSTPTGSTAYSMAAGGSVVHPVVPAILVTPICPHVLSFRSMVFPDHVVIRCTVPDDARSDACVAFDGKFRRLLHRGDSVVIQMSDHPVPTIDRMDHTSDWLGSLKRNFNFNTRTKQKPL